MKGKGERKGKGREGKGREGKGREGKNNLTHPLSQIPGYATAQIAPHGVCTYERSGKNRPENGKYRSTTTN